MSRETIKEQLILCFQDAKSEIKGFNRQTYTNKLDELYSKYSNTLAELEKLYHFEDDNIGVLEDISSVFSDYVYDEVSQESKRKKSLLMLDNNMTMVTYILPLIGKRRERFMDDFADKCIQSWNATFPDTKIDKSSEETIQGGFKTGLCYITTAVCQSLDKDDNCHELTVLRDYRDEYLLTDNEEGVGIVQRYYDIAPTIVKRINRDDNAKYIYQSIWTNYLEPCVQMIEDNEYEQSKELYIEMVDELSEKYFH